MEHKKRTNKTISNEEGEKHTHDSYYRAYDDV